MPIYIDRLNKLECQIVHGAMVAQNEYRRITGGWWLWHGPESFLQTVVAQSLAKDGEHVVYLDTSIKKILKDLERGRGRPAGYEQQRPDISVWFKNLETLRAAIEIKRSVSYNPIRRDAKKIERYLKGQQAAKTGYILAYTEMKTKDPDVYKRCVAKWKSNLGEKWSICGAYVDGGEDDPDWIWGISLLRYDRHH
jgi:hypothetical protein